MSNLTPRPYDHVMIVNSPSGGSETTSYGMLSPAGSFDSNMTEKYRAAISPEYYASPHSSHSGHSGHSNYSNYSGHSRHSRHSRHSPHSAHSRQTTGSTRQSRYTATSPYAAAPVTPDSYASGRSRGMSGLELPSELGKRQRSSERNRGAEAKALSMMNETVGGTLPMRPSSSDAAAIRKNMVLQYKERRRAEKEMRSPPTTLVSIRPKEQMAETSRKVEIISAEDEFETIADFKCQMYIDREQEATKKALRMLSVGSVRNVC